MEELVKHDISEWIENHKIHFVPPVCNKCMFSDQLKAFLVSGPNLRKDFHLEEGEELFYMLKGDMCLRTVNKGTVKDIDIKEGQIYMQFKHILHSPQRKFGTVGLVVERSRSKHEMDCLRFFENEENMEVFFERWFHMNNAETDLPPIIFEYLQIVNENAKSFIKTNCEKNPYKANLEILLDEPVNLRNWLKSNSSEIKKHGCKLLYGPPKFESQIFVYGSGVHKLSAVNGEIFVWFIDGRGTIKFQNNEIKWKAVESTKIPMGSSAAIFCAEDGYFMTVCMPTPNGTEV